MTHEGAQAVADRTAKHFGIAPVPVQVKNVRCGRARYGTRKMTFPKWALTDRGDAYATAYVVHEIAHFVVYARGRVFSDGAHGPYFRSMENEGLTLWGLTIQRSRAYAKAIYSNGECVYKRKRRK